MSNINTALQTNCTELLNEILLVQNESFIIIIH
jgi:hypothetical protein